ncbi:MAG TPA: ABC transporter ATP-binding protein [Candidatus Hydrogenedentes bacterium]|nr:MAG: Lipoprotein-releasing system ATP-binding protein LolD [Candidatus Hydrogenedentes bacterium ADurb.Bin170]HNZ48419.1 ABC transporter ATP-binding protein [Candidatus Hydrogenedentota bacterium]HOD94895.1 ABC transporter ATP-binding protein [Candidatus Hydrogenedentota bacterium]HOR50339.1 ABC transporter ATP-binding protein [Candidatus Hydrogenedentota bacterium]HPK25089.1 ABC transporter ATP-binding protein [Candidatus Hydrogenedentota bacterium]
MVLLEEVTRRLGPGVHFSCEKFYAAPGSRTALWGPSGCGKSTMLNLITGLLRPDSGTLRIDGADITALSESRMDAFRGERMGFVFQTFNLLPPFNALQNVLLGMRFSDTIPEQEWKSRAVAMLNRVGLERRLHSKPGTLSVGERQRVAIARALVNKPRLIVADEPTGSLDPKTAASVMALLLELCEEEKVTLLLVTHDRGIAEQLPDLFDCTGLAREDAS